MTTPLALLPPSFSPDVTIKRVEEMKLGVRSFGMQVEDLPPGYQGYPLHDSTATGQDEVYVPLRGSARLLVEGTEYRLEPGVFARVGPRERRKIVPGPDGVLLLAIAG